MTTTLEQLESEGLPTHLRYCRRRLFCEDWSIAVLFDIPWETREAPECTCEEQRRLRGGVTAMAVGPDPAQEAPENGDRGSVQVHRAEPRAGDTEG